MQGEKRKRNSRITRKLEQLQQTIRNNKMTRRNLDMKNRALAIRAVFASSHSPSVPRGSGNSSKCDIAKPGYWLEFSERRLANVSLSLPGTSGQGDAAYPRPFLVSPCQKHPSSSWPQYTNWLRWPVMGRLELVIAQHPYPGSLRTCHSSVLLWKTYTAPWNGQSTTPRMERLGACPRLREQVSEPWLLHCSGAK